jgi:hypothetical protein
MLEQVPSWTIFRTIYTILYDCIINFNIKCNIEMEDASGIYLFMAFPFIVDER